MVGLSLIAKRCGHCNSMQPLVNFYKDKTGKDGFRTICKTCAAARGGAYRAEHRESISAQKAAYHTKNREAVNAKSAAYREENRDAVKAYNVTYREENRESINAKNTAYREENPTWVRFHQKKSQAKRAGIEFNLVFEDITWPEYCPVLGTLLNYTFGNGSCPPAAPSFDRIDPRKGYVTGNVIVISYRANRIKNDASVDELKLVTSFYEQLIPQMEHSHEAA